MAQTAQSCLYLIVKIKTSASLRNDFPVIWQKVNMQEHAGDQQSTFLEESIL